MSFEVEELGAVKRKISITVPEEVVTKKVDDAYKMMNRQVRMPGFRPGKIPRHILEKQVPMQSLKEVFQDLMQDHYEEALKETGITPAGQPEIDPTGLKDIKKGDPLKFSVILDIKPEIALNEYKGLKIKRKEIRITDQQLEETLEKILARYGHFEHHDDDHEIQKDDHLVIDFQGFFEGAPLEGGAHDNYPVRVGEKKMIEGFEDQLIGHKVGEEFEIRTALPANWNNKVRRVSMPIPGAEQDKQEDLAIFMVKIKEVKKQALPELSEEIAEKEGFVSVEQFRLAVKTDLQGYYEQQHELKIKEDIFNKLVDEYKQEPSETLVKREMKFMIEGMKYQIEQSGTKLEDSGFEPEKAEKEWRPKAVFNTKGYMVLEAIAGKENIHVTQADFDEEFEKLAEQTKQELDVVKSRVMANPDTMEQTKTKLLGQKTMDFLFSHCEFEYVKEEDKEAADKA